MVKKFLGLLTGVILVGWALTMLTTPTVNSAVTCDYIVNGQYSEVVNCLWGADADISVDINHSLGAVANVDIVLITPNTVNCTSISNSAALSSVYNSALPYVSQKSATNITMTRRYVPGSMSCNTTTVIQRLHSIMK